MAIRHEKIHDRMTADLPINAQVSPAIVDDPYSDRGEKLQLLRSTRDDPLAGMLSRDQIDEAQFKAGRKWQQLHESSTIGAIQAIDPGKEAVDGGKMRDFLTDRQIRAFEELSKAAAELGGFGGSLIFRILAERKSISEAADFFGCRSQREVDYIGRRFRECLETLAVHWGYAQPKYQQR